MDDITGALCGQVAHRLGQVQRRRLRRGGRAATSSNRNREKGEMQGNPAAVLYCAVALRHWISA
jgi:hypothetical protein